MPEITGVGDKIYLPLSFTNNGYNTELNAVVNIVVPPGVAFEGKSIPRGTFMMVSPTLALWTIGNMVAGETVSGTFTFAVTNPALATESPDDDSGYSTSVGFEFNVVISGDNLDNLSGNNSRTYFFPLTTCAPASGAIGLDSGCICGDLSLNDTDCTNGETEWRLVSGSRVNLSNSFELNADGTYNTMGMILNPFEASHFQYTIWCKPVLGEWVQTSGPAMVTIPALLSEPFVIDAENINFSGLNEYLSMEDAVNDLGSGKMFLAGLSNVEGWSYRTLLVNP